MGERYGRRMMRGVALGTLALAAGTALFTWYSGRGSSFASYSEDQLRALELGYQQVVALGPVEPLTAPSRKDARSLARAHETTEQAAVSLSLLRDERRRRMLFTGALVVAALSVLALVALRGRGWRGSSGEEERLVAALGTPGATLAAERARAAKLLGIPADASPQAVEDALSAGLAARHPSRLVGLAPGLRQVAEEQRAALIRARDCLLAGTSARDRRRDSGTHRALPGPPT